MGVTSDGGIEQFVSDGTISSGLGSDEIEPSTVPLADYRFGLIENDRATMESVLNSCPQRA